MGANGDSVLFSFPLRAFDDYRETLTSAKDTPEFDEAHRSLGLTRVMTWVQREPDYAVIRWEGENVVEALARAQTTDNAFMARWRGLVRVFAGPEGAEGVWEPESRQQIFSWNSGKEGPQTDARIFHGTSVVERYLGFLDDVRNDSALFGAYDRIRQRQGITRVEMWHQKIGDTEVVLRVVEGNDLDAAYAAIDKGETELDRRLTKIETATLHQSHMSRNNAELIVDWKA